MVVLRAVSVLVVVMLSVLELLVGPAKSVVVVVVSGCDTQNPEPPGRLWHVYPAQHSSASIQTESNGTQDAQLPVTPCPLLTAHRLPLSHPAR